MKHNLKKIYKMLILLLYLTVTLLFIFFGNERNTIFGYENKKYKNKEIITVNNINYITSKEELNYFTEYKFKRTNKINKSKINKATIANQIGLSNKEYNDLSLTLKTKIENAKSLYVQESIYEIKQQKFKILNKPEKSLITNKKSSQKTRNVPDHNTSNGYLKFRITVLDTGKLFSTGNRIIYFHVEAEWLKLPFRRRNDYLVFGIPNNFRAIEKAEGSSSWWYALTPDKVVPGDPKQTGTRHGSESSGKWWGRLKDGDFKLDEKSADGNNPRYIMTYNLPNKANYYTPQGEIKCSYGYSVEEIGKAHPFNMKVIYGHDQSLFGVKAPTITIKGINISLSSKHKEYPHTAFNIAV